MVFHNSMSDWVLLCYCADAFIYLYPLLLSFFLVITEEGPGVEPRRRKSHSGVPKQNLV